MSKYATPEMQRIFSPDRKFVIWSVVETELLQTLSDFGLVPKGDVDKILRTRRPMTSDAIREIAELEERNGHEMVAFLQVFKSHMGGDWSRWVHYGLTSSDVMDTALAITLRAACEELIGNLSRLISSLANLRDVHGQNIMVGRTHGVPAEPMMFGHKISGWLEEVNAAYWRVRSAKEGLRFGKISGAVGNHAHISKEVEKEVLGKFSLQPDPFSSQVISRDKHAEALMSLAILGGVLERISVGLRLMAREGEVEEAFGETQVGSSAMPHKRNPIKLERISGLARLLRADAAVGLENIALWDERDISNSSAEREVYERAFNVAAFMVSDLTATLNGLKVNPSQMVNNLGEHPEVYSEALMLAMIRNGAPREVAYRIMKEAAPKWSTIWTGEVRNWLSTDEITQAINPDHYKEE